MTSKHGIRPSRRPRKEDPYVTIGNQDKQIKLLIERVAALEPAWSAQSERAADLAHRLGSVTEAYNRLLGWQDCAREMLSGKLPDFPSTAPGV